MFSFGDLEIAFSSPITASPTLVSPNTEFILDAKRTSLWAPTTGYIRDDRFPATFSDYMPQGAYTYCTNSARADSQLAASC